MALQPMYPGQVNSPQTELASAITDTDTTIPLLDTSKLPAPPNIATIGVGEDAETILYTGKSGNNLTGVTRGFQGAAKAWVQGTKVARNFTAYDYDALRQNVSSHASEHITGGSDVIPDATTTSSGLMSAEDKVALDGLFAAAMLQNAIINGGFDVWQRGTTFTATSGYAADRWYYNHSGGSGTVSRQSFPPGQTEVPGNPAYFIRISRTAPANSGNTVLGTNIEDVRTLAGQRVTLSFWARVSSGTKQITTRVQQNFGTGGSSSVEAPGETHTITTTWTRYVHTFDMPSIAGKTIGTNSRVFVRFLEEGLFTAFTLDIWGVQLHVGDVALPFQPRPYALEELLCQRYCQVRGGNVLAETIGVGYVSTTNSATIHIPLPTRGRTTPTIIPIGNIIVSSSGVFEVATSLTVDTLRSSPYWVNMTATIGPHSLELGNVVTLRTQDENSKVILDMEL